MNLRILVAGKTHKPHLAILLRFGQRFRRAVGSNKKLRVILKSHAVTLPKVEMVGLQTPQRLFQHLQRQARIATMGARFGHQENFVPPPLQARAHPDFRFSAAILPTIIEKGNSSIHSPMDDLDRSFFVGSIAEVMASKAQRGGFGIGVSELSEGDGASRSLRHGLTSSRQKSGIMQNVFDAQGKANVYRKMKGMKLCG